MFHRASTVAAALCCLAALPSVHGQLPPRAPAAPAQQPLPPPKPLKDEEIAKKLLELEKMGKDLDESKFGHNAKIIKELRDIGTSGDKAFALWLDCKKEFDFDQKGKTASEWADWKRRQTKDANHDRDAGLQMSVQWLSIVLMYCNARSDSARNEAVTAAVAFLDPVVDRIKKIEKDKEGGPAGGRDGGRRGGNGEGEGELDQDVLNSLFAKHYKLESSVSRKDGGAFVPGDVGGIYEKMILPFYRSMRQPTSLMSAWKRRIEQETSIAEARHGSGPKEKFNTEKLPELKWGQAVDYYRLGQEETATSAMIAIIKGNMTHPRASQWIIELTAMLKKEDVPQVAEKSPAKPGAAPGSPPVPEPPPPVEPEPATDTKTPPPDPLVDPTKAPPAPLVDPTKAPPDRLVDPTREIPPAGVRPLKP